MRHLTCFSFLRQHVAVALAVMAAMLWPQPGTAGEAASVPLGAASASGVDARTWLRRIHSAASQRNYQGTLVVTANGSMSSSRLAHYCEGSQYYERIDMLDGQPQRVYPTTSRC